MDRVCAWCGRTIEGTNLDDGNADLVTHGICAECGFHLRAQMGMPLLEYLDGIPIPIVLVDEDVAIRGANRPAKTFLLKDPDKALGRLCGDVFECVNACLPGGCGETVHCTSCAIRNAATDTYQTGREHLDIPAVFRRNHAGEPKEATVLISTWKAGGVVLLRVVGLAKIS